MGDRLRFELKDDGTWFFYNEDNLELGYLERIRVGAWMHWCHFLFKDCYLSPGCADEVREFQRKLGSQKTSEAKDE